MVCGSRQPSGERFPRIPLVIVAEKGEHNMRGIERADRREEHTAAAEGEER